MYAVLVAAGALLSAPAGGLASGCGDPVIADWRNGRIDGEYPVRCYRDALDSLPADVRVYGTAEQDIRSAMTRRLGAAARNARPSRAVQGQGSVRTTLLISAAAAFGGLAVAAVARGSLRRSR